MPSTTRAPSTPPSRSRPDRWQVTCTPRQPSTRVRPNIDTESGFRPHPRSSANAPADNAWNPTLLEFTMIGFDDRDSAEHWAMYLHQQRSVDDYRDQLGLPLALHVAQLADQYALPYDYPGE
ncbi:DUF3893 domain-containing protein [Nocardia sp. SYP-A9097]|uniref:RNaseH domain-containing protein n=1 Tax=Nocardia sp. SYP-A9097 TaxID=2663237 RepID=UPI00129B8EAE|nr:RNaseH domain-containing protein [Nocardia sp. SYP-A9097]MRH87898.1 DUF3893 domain-containing protein [Nocardia sp. SYP-A9097]